MNNKGIYIFYLMNSWNDSENSNNPNKKLQVCSGEASILQVDLYQIDD